MDELEKQLKALLGLATDDATRKRLVELIHENARQEIWRPIADSGFTAGKAESKKALDKAEADVLSLSGQVREKDEKITDYERKAPGSKEVVAGLEKKIEGLTKEVGTTREKLNGKLRAALKQRDLAEFERELVAGGLKPRLAKAEVLLLDQRSEYMDGEGDDALPVLRVYQSATQKIPITVPTDGNLLKAVAQDVIKVAPPEDRVSNVDTGGGVRSDNGQHSGAGANEYDKIRAEAAERAKLAGTSARADIVGAFRAPVGAGT